MYVEIFFLSIVTGKLDSVIGYPFGKTSGKSAKTINPISLAISIDEFGKKVLHVLTESILASAIDITKIDKQIDINIFFICIFF